MLAKIEDRNLDSSFIFCINTIFIYHRSCQMEFSILLTIHVLDKHILTVAYKPYMSSLAYVICAIFRSAELSSSHNLIKSTK